MTETADDMTISIAITDTGKGIRLRPRSAFSPFEQADGSTTMPARRHRPRPGHRPPAQPPDARRHYGEQHTGPGQHLHADRPPGQNGKPGRRRQRGHQPAATVRTARKRLLLAEDDEINREVALELLLGDYPELSIDVAENGALAVERPAPALRPDPDGHRDAGTRRHRRHGRAIRQLPGHAATPIVAMTANAFAEDKARCLDAGMSDFHRQAGRRTCSSPCSTAG